MDFAEFSLVRRVIAPVGLCEPDQRAVRTLDDEAEPVRSLSRERLAPRSLADVHARTLQAKGCIGRVPGGDVKPSQRIDVGLGGIADAQGTERFAVLAKPTQVTASGGAHESGYGSPNSVDHPLHGRKSGAGEGR